MVLAALARSAVPASPPAYFRLPEPCGEPPSPEVQICLPTSVTTKPSAREGFAVTGGVVNLNGIEHTKE